MKVLVSGFLPQSRSLTVQDDDYIDVFVSFIRPYARSLSKQEDRVHTRISLLPKDNHSNHHSGATHHHENPEHPSPVDALDDETGDDRSADGA